MAERAELLNNEIPIALKNLATTQARDGLMYVSRRGSTYRPIPKQYRVGDFLYVKRKSNITLNCSAPNSTPNHTD